MNKIAYFENGVPYYENGNAGLDILNRLSLHSDISFVPSFGARSGGALGSYVKQGASTLF
ncbi:hypothetical protein [Xenorhabdus sp. IM139775]|uniref:hypothetical protein n=1 Tax=Xenorhabdus sp. IM139775 TaxID=3025876 RepID=UPI002358FFE8|nr:hypothetical protein [Xenorhabdus sp. IM139775]MDC9594775.1 hypothetical protein [Xenorhabdus sp. IM139775]